MVYLWRAVNAEGEVLGGQGAFASKVVIEDGSVEVTREVDGGMQSVALKLPAIVTTDLRLNEPRYASLPNIMKAKKKPIDEKTPADYGVDVAPRLKVLKTAEPGGCRAALKRGLIHSWCTPAHSTPDEALASRAGMLQQGL